MKDLPNSQAMMLVVAFYIYDTVIGGLDLSIYCGVFLGYHQPQNRVQAIYIFIETLIK